MILDTEGRAVDQFDPAIAIVEKADVGFADVVRQSKALNGLDSLLSIVQMPKGVPVATVAIGSSGAANAGLLAVAILATSRPELRTKLQAYRDEMADEVGRASLS